MFKINLSVGKITEKRPTDPINFSYVSGNINNFFRLIVTTHNHGHIVTAI